MTMPTLLAFLIVLPSYVMFLTEALVAPSCVLIRKPFELFSTVLPLIRTVLRGQVDDVQLSKRPA